MIDLGTLLTVCNTVFLIGFGIHYFRKNYIVMTVEDFNVISEAVEDYNRIIQESEELAGGEGFDTGFFKDQLDEDEEEIEEEDSSKSETVDKCGSKGKKGRKVGF